MFRLNFKAGIATASKNSADNYYMIDLADDRYDYKNSAFPKTNQARAV